MIKRTDWEAADRELLAEGRRRLGEPPTDDELLAFSRGELEGEKASRIRELLCCYPELARVVAMPFPSPEEIRPGDPDFIPDEVLEQDWAAVEARLSAEPPVPVPAPALVPSAPPGRPRWFDPGALLESSLFRWRLSTAAALGLAGVLGLLVFQARMDVGRLEREIAEPRMNPERRLLLPDGARGTEETPIALPLEAESFLLTLAVADHRPYPGYHVRTVEVNGNGERETWSASVPRPSGNVFAIWAPRDFLRSGAPHRLELYGVRDGQRHLLASYTIQLSADAR